MIKQLWSLFSVTQVEFGLFNLQQKQMAQHKM